MKIEGDITLSNVYNGVGFKRLDNGNTLGVSERDEGFEILANGKLYCVVGEDVFDPLKIPNKTDMIHNGDELYKAVTGYNDAPDDPVYAMHRINKRIYRDYPCGPWLRYVETFAGGWLDREVSVGSIIEGHDYEVGPFSLRMPFNIKDLHELLERVDNEVSEYLSGVDDA